MLFRYKSINALRRYVKSFEGQAEEILSALAAPGGRIGRFYSLNLYHHNYNIIRLSIIYLVIARDTYNLLLGYILSFFYIANVVARPKALSELSLLDWSDLKQDGICLMANFKVSVHLVIM